MMVVATIFSHQVVFDFFHLIIAIFLLKALFVCLFCFCFCFVFFVCVCVCALVSKFQSMVSMFYILLWFEEYFFNNFIYIYIYI